LNKTFKLVQYKVTAALDRPI